MQGAGALACDRAAVLRRAIAGMALKAITRIARGQTRDQRITRLLGEHAGGGDRQAMQIARHQGALPARPQAQRQCAINKQQLGLPAAPLQRPEHRQLRGHADAQTIDLSG